MGCCSSETKQESKTTIPAYLEQGGEQLVSMASDLANKDYQSNPLQIADFAPDQQAAFEQIRNLNPEISTERVVDENGRLGKISDYFNPYADPAFKAIQDAEDANRKRIGASSTSAGAYGDARHGILEVGNMAEAQNARVSAAYQAFDKAMTARGQDLARFTDVDKTNFSQALQAVQALLTSGGIQQGQEQAKNQAIFDDFLRQYGHDFNVLEAFGAALSGAPHSTTTTSTSTTPSNSISQLLGSASGALLGT